jgi:hypothetical protein
MYQLWTAYVIQLFDVCTMAVRAPRPAYSQTRRACMHALQSEGKIILIYSYFEIQANRAYGTEISPRLFVISFVILLYAISYNICI